MPQYVEVKGQTIEFPDGMSAADIEKAIKSNMMAVPPKEAFSEALKREVYTSAPFATARGLKDIVDTGAQFLSSGFDRLTGGNEGQQVKQANEAGKQDFAKTTEGSMVAPVFRVLGNALGVAPATSFFGAGATAANLPKLGAAIASGGVGSQAGNLATRVAGGAISGYTGAGLVDPESANAGGMIGAAIPMAGPVVRAIGAGTKQALGQTTGVGTEALSQAFRAGQQGGQVGRQFTEAMRGQSSMDDVLGAARDNLARIGQQKQAAYRSGMANIKMDKTVLGFDGIDDALKNARGISMFKGQAKNPRAAQLVDQVAEEVNAWKALDPAEYHTPEGLDALKQRIGGILESIPFEEKSARSAVGNIYNSIKTEINKQAPEYAKVMKDYTEATELVREIERALSLGKKASADTSMRKLQSLMRNNVNTSYGFRDQLAKQLVDQGGNELLPMLAGQALSDWAPRGIQRAAAGTGSGVLALTGNLPAAAGMAAISSPRLAGETLFGLGRASNLVPQGAGILTQGAARTLPLIPAQ